MFIDSLLILQYFSLNLVQTSLPAVAFNPLTPMGDKDRISPYSINTESSRQVRRIEKKNLFRGLQVDPIQNSLN